MSSGFITEAEAAEVRKRRQEEWERVRKADDPIERPEEPYDNRSLFERLQEQKQKKDLEYEEAHKLKNMIKGLDDDEIQFLDLVDRTRIEADRKKEIEEEQELNDYRNRVAILQEKSVEDRLQAEISVNKPKPAVRNHTSQQKLLKGVVVKKRKISEPDSTSEAKQVKTENGNGTATAPESTQGEEVPNVTSDNSEVPQPSALKTVAILPGLGNYDDSTSDEETSSDSSIDSDAQPKLDLLGRKICKKEQS